MTNCKPKILIADISKDLIEILKIYLESKGFEVFAAYDGKEALKRVSEILPDLIILSISLPEMTGLEVCQRIRAKLRFSKIPVIVLTALPPKEFKKKALGAGADVFMTKPFEFNDLMEKIESLLGKDIKAKRCSNG